MRDDPIAGPPDPQGGSQVRQELVAYRGRIEHEDNLMGMRVSWLVAAESFLFVAYAILVNGDAGRANNADAHRVYEVIPWLGVALVLCVAASLVAAVRAIYRLSMDAPPRPEVWPPIRSSGWVYVVGLSGALGVPLVVLGAWVFILAAR